MDDTLVTVAVTFPGNVVRNVPAHYEYEGDPLKRDEPPRTHAIPDPMHGYRFVQTHQGEWAAVRDFDN